MGRIDEELDEFDEMSSGFMGSEMCAGWEVVCPDGKVRHFPYHNYGDATCDAEVYSSKGCRGNSLRPSVLQRREGPCPEGIHTVRPNSFVHKGAQGAES